MKKITSLSLGFSFLIMTYTGLMLFIVPHGRVAYWSDWHLLGLSKSQYGELHTTSMVSFLLFAILHIYYNWKPLVSYMKNKTKQISFTKKEFLIAFLLNLVFVVGTLSSVTPFKTFLDFGEGVKEIWTKEYGEPPYGHAEETKLIVFCKKMHIDFETAKTSLKENNIIFEDKQRLKDIARANNTSPSAIYKIIQKNTPKDELGTPQNLGRKTLQNLSDLQKIDLQKAMKILKDKGIEDITANTKMRHVADELEMEPLDVYKMLLNK